MKKSFVSVMLAAAMAASLFGTSAFAEEAGESTIPVRNSAYEGTFHSAENKHDSISISMDIDPGNLSPEAAANGGGTMWKWEVYERLFEINGLGGDLIPTVAESYEKIDDTTYRIKLFEGVTDSDGNEIHSSDVGYAYDTLIAAGNRMSGDIAKYDHIEVIDDYNFDMIMKEPLTGLSDLSAILGQPFVYSEKAAQDHNLSVDPCGTGPYKVTEYQSGSSITMEARDDYWAEGTDHQTRRQTANVQKIIYRVVQEPSQNAVGLTTGELDESDYVAAQDIAQFEEGGALSDKYYTDKVLNNLTIALFPNADPEKSECSDINLRAAIFYALDGTQLAQASGVNDFVRASTLGNAKFVGYQSKWETEDNFYNVQDFDLAKDYLSKSSYDGKSLVIACNTDAASNNVAVAIQAMLAQIGINCQISALEGNILDQEQVAGNYDLMITMMASDDYLPIVWQRWFSEDFHSVSHTINNCADPKIQELGEKTWTVGSSTDENIDAFHEYMVENFYGYGLYSECKSSVLPTFVTDACWNFQDMIVPGGCTYVENEA